MPATAEAQNPEATVVPAAPRSPGVTVNPDLYLALQLRSFETGRSIEDFVDEAIRENLQDELEELEDLRTCDERENEKTISFDEMVSRLNLDGKLRH